MSHRGARHLMFMPHSPNQSLQDGGFITPSELVLLRIPVAAGSQLLEASTTAGTGLPQPSQSQHRRAPQHHAFVRFIMPHPLGLVIEVYPVVSFSRQGGAVNGYNAASETVKQSLIPLPPLSSTFPTPPLFGPQLFIGGWVNSRDAFLSVHPVRFELLRSVKFKKFASQVMLGNEELARIDTYRNGLSADKPRDQGGPSCSGSCNNRGEEPATTGQNDEEENGGGGFRRTGLRGVLCCGDREQNRAANEAQDGNATDILPDASLISDVESTDEDCLATIKDDLILLAHIHPSWIPELEKYIEAERAEVEAERTLRVESWLQSVQ